MALTTNFSRFQPDDMFDPNTTPIRRPGLAGGIPRDFDRTTFVPMPTPLLAFTNTNLNFGGSVGDDGVFFIDYNVLAKREIPDKDADTFEVVNFTTYFDGESDGS